MSAITINGMSLEYKEKGTGEPLVFVHGSASDLRTWSHQQDIFKEHYRTIAYSRRYHWPNASIPDDADYVMTDHVDDLEELLRTFDATPAHLVGHSYGAFVCLLLAIRSPELIRTLVLGEPPVLTLFVSNTPKILELLKLLVTHPRTGLAVMKFGAKGFAPAKAAAENEDMEEANRIFGRAVLGDEFYEQLSEERRNQIQANAIKAELTGSGFAPLKDEKIRGVEIPTLLMNGSESPALFHRLLDRLEELIPDTKRFKVPEASHIMHEDNPSVFSKTVQTFLTT